MLATVPADLVVLLPRLEVVLERGRRRQKDVPAELVRQQHAEAATWPAARLVDTSDLIVAQSVAAVVERSTPLGP